ncbi:MAG: ATP-binding protein [Cytophagales bacterium]|nr:ATP-binding protein [Cytophagales bacterium]MDW8384150.1 ATP-binding protein [Flammeovirgaceae bacterium]
MKAKSLSRVVLFNVAQVEYANIKLDGNTCFIGKNNLGKTTILRVILFFYNANTQRLGISRSKKPFEEYYFQYPNSYIIYEVSDGVNAFHIWVYKSDSIKYRFVNAPFDKSYYLDEKENVLPITEVQKRFITAVPQIEFTKPIDSFKRYREILYGAVQEREFKKYALLYTNGRFDNIPRAISDIFNSAHAEIKADFVKEFIANAVSDVGTEIELSLLRNHLKQFSGKFRDLTDYKKPENEQRRQLIQEKYQLLQQLKAQEVEFADRLGAALKYTASKKMQLEAQIAELDHQINEYQLQLNALESQYKVSTDGIREQLGIYKSKLREAESKRREYERMNIEQILELFAQKPDLERKLSQLYADRNDLTAAYQDIQSQFDNRLSRLRNEKKEFELELREEVALAEKQLREEIQLQKEFYAKEENTAREKCSAQIAELKVSIERAKGTIRLLENEMLNIKRRDFFKAEIQALRDELSALEKQLIQNQLNFLSGEKELQRLMEEGKKIDAQLEKEYETFQKNQYAKIEASEQQLNRIKHRLQIKDETFFGFLEREYPKWTETIGKVVNEEILFRSDLNPELKATAFQNFYGVKLNLTNVPISVKKVADYEQEKQIIQKEIQELVRQLHTFEEELKEKIKKEKTKFATQKNELEKNLHQLRYQIGQAHNRKQEIELSLADYLAKADEEIHKQLEICKQKISVQQIEISKTEQKIQEVTQNLNITLETLRTSLSQKINQLQHAHTDKLAKLEERRRIQNAAFHKEENDIKLQYKKALEEKGIDSKDIENADKRIAEVQQQLHELRNIEKVVFKYQNDKEEYLDRIEEFKLERAKLEQELCTLEETFKTERKHLIALQKECYDKRVELEKELIKCNEGLSYYEKVRPELHPHLEARIESASMRAVDEEISILCKNIDNNEKEILKERSLFEGYIRDYVGRFREGNHFGFRIDRNASARDYERFAEELENFINEGRINASIEEIAQNRNMLLDTIAMKVTELIRQLDKIDDKIAEMKRDFKKAEFEDAKLIEYIDVRVQEAESPILKILQKIAKFHAENSYYLRKDSIFTDNTSHSDLDRKSVELLEALQNHLEKEPQQEYISLKDLFKLQFKIKEGKNVIDWTERLHDIGSEGTDILVKSIIYITLIYIFLKESVRNSQQEPFMIHAMIDEVGKLSATYLRELIGFAQKRHIYLVNGLPNESKLETYYNYTYKLEKESSGNVLVRPLLTSVIV